MIRGSDSAGFVVQLGYADGLILKDNIITSPHAEAGGIYVWGTSRYNPAPSRDVTIAGNVIRVAGRGVFLNGVNEGLVQGNIIKSIDANQRLVIQRAERIEGDVTHEGK